MRRVAEDNAETSRIMLGLLDAVEQDRVQSQRHLASELGIALGLVNAYLKRCMKKGLVKVRQAPARRFAEMREIAPGHRHPQGGSPSRARGPCRPCRYRSISPTAISYCNL